MPAFDRGSFFGALLDREKGGEFSIHPSEHYEVERRYLGDSAVLETRFKTVGPTVVVRGVIAGAFPVPTALRLLVASRSKWRG